MFYHLTFAWLFMEHLSLLLDNPVRLALWPHLQVRRPRQLLVQSIFLPSQSPLGLGGPLPGAAFISPPTDPHQAFGSCSLSLCLI